MPENSQEHISDMVNAIVSDGEARSAEIARAGWNLGYMAAYTIQGAIDGGADKRVAVRISIEALRASMMR